METKGWRSWALKKDKRIADLRKRKNDKKLWREK
jgi:hypothetical protein